LFKEFNFYYPFLHNPFFGTSFSALNKTSWDYFSSRMLFDLIPIVISCLWNFSLPAVRRYPRRIKNHKNKNMKLVYRTVKVVTIVWLPYKFPLGCSNVDTTVCGFYWKGEVNSNQFRQSKATGALPSGPWGSDTWRITAECRHHDTTSWQALVDLWFSKSLQS